MGLNFVWEYGWRIEQIWMDLGLFLSDNGHEYRRDGGYGVETKKCSPENLWNRN